jgi:hypothetical protein
MNGHHRETGGVTDDDRLAGLTEYTSRRAHERARAGACASLSSTLPLSTFLLLQRA